MATPHPNQMVTCPYNAAHQLKHYRMHIHLQKCRKQHLNSKKTTCPFDATHVVNDAELDHHVSVCPKRYMLDTQLYVNDDDYRPTGVVAQPPPVIPTEENWDDDDCTSYKPDPSKKPHLIVKLQGGTPSERRKARMEGIKNYRPQNTK